MASSAPLKDVVIDPKIAARVEGLLKGSIDMHCHSGPSVMERRMDHIEAIEEASSVGMRALLFKDHFYSVTPVVELLKGRYADKNVELFSGVPLNDTTGGLNPWAVDHGLVLGAKLVWMPTFSAANHHRHNYRGHRLVTRQPMRKPTYLTVLNDRGDLKDEVKEILDEIAKHDAIVSGGHLHITEIFKVFEEAKKRGVKRLLAQHPTYIIDATLEDLKQLAGMGAYMEHSLCMYIEESRFQHFEGAELKQVIEAGTLEQTILGSDLGQVRNPTPVSGFRAVIALCIELGYTDEQIRKLIGGNAARLLGLDKAA